MAKSTNPFRYFDSSPEVIRLVVMRYVKDPLSLRTIEDPGARCGIDICLHTLLCLRLVETSGRWTEHPYFT